VKLIVAAARAAPTCVRELLDEGIVVDANYLGSPRRSDELQDGVGVRWGRFDSTG
jgi:hypothetical protein